MVSPVVTTDAGRLRGCGEAGVLVFQGIRYATASRFSPPQPPEPWAGVRDAQAYGPSRPQMVGEDKSYFARTLGPVARADERVTDEDCLFLNVWTPTLDGGGATRRPVPV